jgi:hypothetical protein
LTQYAVPIKRVACEVDASDATHWHLPDIDKSGNQLILAPSEWSARNGKLGHYDAMDICFEHAEVVGSAKHKAQELDVIKIWIKRVCANFAEPEDAIAVFPRGIDA